MLHCRRTQDPWKRAIFDCIGQETAAFVADKCVQEAMRVLLAQDHMQQSSLRKVFQGRPHTFQASSKA